MENAARALTMAAGVLIGIMIISIAVYLFTSLGNTSSEIYSKVCLLYTSDAADD